VYCIMPVNKPYCGLGKTPKGKKSGTMRECLEMKQVRKYGELKIDSRTIAGSKKVGNIKETRDELIKQRAAALGGVNRFKGRMKTLEEKKSRKKLTEDETAKLKEYKSELKKAEDILEKSTAKLRKVLAKIDAEKKKAAKPKEVKPKAVKPKAVKPKAVKPKAVKSKVVPKRPGTKKKIAKPFNVVKILDKERSMNSVLRRK